MTTTVLSALSISVVPSKRIPSAIAIFSIASSLAQCFAPNIGTNLAYAGQFKVLFVTALVLLYWLLFYCQGLMRGRFLCGRRRPAVRYVLRAAAMGSLALIKSFCVPAIPAAILLLFNGIIYTSITNYLSLYGIERDLKNIGIFLRSML